MKVFQYSAKGNRITNEDFLLSRGLDSGRTLYLLADGMGGYQHGEMASSLACSIIADSLSKNLNSEDISESVDLAFQAANNEIGQQRHVLRERLGTTIAGALFDENWAYFFWLGDVRIYHYRNNEVLFQSEDHSFINDMKKRGFVSASDMLRYRNIVTRSLMGDPVLDKIPVVKAQIESGDTVVLCSDGLWQNRDIGTLLNLTDNELQNFLLENACKIDDNYSLWKVMV